LRAARTTSPPCSRAIERGTARPRPTPAVSGGLRELSIQVERLKDLLALAARNSGTVILDSEDDAPSLGSQFRCGSAAILYGVIDEVGDRAAQRRRPAGDSDTTNTGIGHLGPGVRSVLADALGQSIGVF